MKNMLSGCQFIGRNPDFLMPLLLELPVLKHLQSPGHFFFSRRLGGLEPSQTPMRLAPVGPPTGVDKCLASAGLGLNRH